MVAFNDLSLGSISFAFCYGVLDLRGYIGRAGVLMLAAAVLGAIVHTHTHLPYRC